MEKKKVVDKMRDNLSEDFIGSRIVEVFTDASSLWRSPGGIARETGLPVTTVNSYLNLHTDLFEKSPVTPSGISLYTLAINKFSSK